MMSEDCESQNVIQNTYDCPSHYIILFIVVFHRLRQRVYLLCLSLRSRHCLVILFCGPVVPRKPYGRPGLSVLTHTYLF